MSEPRTIDCPRCNEPIEYSPHEEGHVGACPHCNEKVWYSKLAHPPQKRQDRVEASDSTSSIAPAPPPNRSTTAWFVLALLGGFILFDNYRLRTEVRALGNEIRASHQSQDEQRTTTSTERAALAKAELNQAQLDAIVSEVNAIETVIESRLTQFSNRSVEDADRIDTLSTSLDAMVEEFDELEFTITEIHEAINVLMDNYNRLEAELSRR